MVSEIKEILIRCGIATEQRVVEVNKAEKEITALIKECFSNGRLSGGDYAKGFNDCLEMLKQKLKEKGIDIERG